MVAVSTVRVPKDAGSGRPVALPFPDILPYSQPCVGERVLGCLVRAVNVQKLVRLMRVSIIAWIPLFIIMLFQEGADHVGFPCGLLPQILIECFADYLL